MRTKGLYAVLLAALCIGLLPTSTAFAGRLFATGHDLDLHCHFGAQCGYVSTSVDYVRAGAPDPTKPVLVLERLDGDWTNALNNAYSGSPPPTVVIDPRSLAWASTPLTTASFSAIVVGSDITCGGCDLNGFGSDTTDSDAINARAADIATFFNAGGGLVFASGASHGDGSAPDDVYYNAVPLPLGGLPVSPPFALTPAGLALGLTPTDANCCATHNSFVEPPTGSSIIVAERDAAGAVETLFTEGTISGGKIYTLDLDPPSADNPQGTDHTVTATLKDQDGPVAGVVVTFTVTGANPTTGNGTTDANGEATFTWTGTNAGDDLVVACFDANANSECDDGDPTARATKHWVESRRSKLSVDDVTVTEGNTGYTPATPATFTVSLDNPSTGPVDVQLATADGTATSPADYQGGVANVHFDPGETSRPVTINVNGDLVDEPNEQHAVHLQNPDGAVIDDGDGVGTIVDDDRNGTFSCRATALRIGANEAFVANPPDDPCKDGVRFVTNTKLNLGGTNILVEAVKATTDVTPDDPVSTSPAPGDSATAHAETVGVTIVSGLNVLKLSVLRADATASCKRGGPQLSSSGNVTLLSANGKPYGEISSPVTIPLVLATVRLNQVVTGNGRITRRALVLDNLLLPDVVVSEATADVHGNPCSA